MVWFRLCCVTHLQMAYTALLVRTFQALGIWEDEIEERDVNVVGMIFFLVLATVPSVDRNNND